MFTKSIYVNIVLWIIQGILAAMFIPVGAMIVTQPKEKLAPKFPWVNDFPTGIVKLNGVSKILGGIGLIIPMLTGIATILTSLAAMGLCTIMILATAYNIRKHDMKAVVANVIIFLLAAFIAYGRF